MKRLEIKPEVILFDLGGVVIDVNWQMSLYEQNCQENFDELRRGLKDDPLHIDFELGKIDEADFLNNLVSRFSTPIKPETLKLLWNGAIRGVFPDAKKLIELLTPTYRLAVLSNTNILHYNAFKRFTIFRNFEKIFCSHDLHLRKPDPKIYHTVLNELNVEPQKILFIDDLKQNIEAAQKVGLQTFHCQRPNNLEQLLMLFKKE